MMVALAAAGPGRMPWMASLILWIALALPFLPRAAPAVVAAAAAAATAAAAAEEQTPETGKKARGSGVVVLASVADNERAALFQCFSAGERSEGIGARTTSLEDSRLSDRRRCCRAVWRCANAMNAAAPASLALLVENHQSSWSVLDAFRGDPRELCGESDLLSAPAQKSVPGRRRPGLLLNALVELPSVPLPADDAAAPRLPLYALLSIQRRTSPTIAIPPSGAGAPAATGWRHVVWDDGRNRTAEADGGEGPAPGPFEPEGGGGAGDAKFFGAELDSHLSESGGMHRTLRHALTIELPDEEARNDGSSEGDGSARWELELWILLHLPSDVFVNVNDAFEAPPPQPLKGQDWDLRASVVTVQGERIDEEQPEFASRSHAVLLRVRAELLPADYGSAARRSLAFATKVHLRYPRPASSGAEPFCRVVMLAPTIVAGTATRRAGKGPSQTVYRWKPQLSDSHSKRRLAAPPLLATRVAAGRGGDLPWVALLTLAAALAGGAAMLRDISRVADWGGR